MRYAKLRLAVFIALLVAGSFSYGYLSHRNHWFPAPLLSGVFRAIGPAPAASEPRPPGFWQPIALSDTGTDAGQLTKQLGTLPYLSGYEAATPSSGVVRYDSTAAYGGLNYYTSGHATEVLLMDMNGNKLHTWHYDPPKAPGGDGSPHRAGYLRRARLLPDGDVLAIYDPLGDELVRDHLLVKLDVDSDVLWSYGGGAHHDFDVASDGTIYVLGRDYRLLAPESPQYPGAFWKWPWESLPDYNVLEDFLIVLSSDGEELRRVSILDAFVESPFSVFAEQAGQRDVLHTNTLEILTDRLQSVSPAFAPGNILISASYANAIGVLDLNRERIVWALAGPWHRQHQPTVLENGNMLIFDNNGNHGFSKVIEFDPFTLEISWSYEGNVENGFAAPALGSAIRLPNGNTLITESTAGRAFEVTPDKRIVWEFLNPERAGEDGELVAVIPEMLRLRGDLAWLPRNK